MSLGGQAADYMAKGLKFSTYGNDCWVDGSETNAVAAGECYALVWKQNGATFAGLPTVPPNPDDPYALGEEVWLVDYFPVAELDAATGRMRCPEQTIGIGKLPSWETTNGTWTVYLLDTRYRQADGSVACGFDTAVTNAPRRINAYKAVPGLTDFTIGTTLGPAWETKVGGHEDGTPVVTDVATEPKVGTVTFDARGGTCEAEPRVRTYGDDYGELPTATRTGYAFVGWFTAAEGGTKIFAESPTDGDRTLFAHWENNRYSIHFDPAGGQGEMPDAEFAYDVTANLPLCAFANKGCRFTGWATNEVGGVVYRNGEKVLNLTAEADGKVGLFAVWTEISVPTFVLGASVSIDAEEALGADLAGYAAKNLPSGLTFRNGKITGTAKAATALTGQEVSFEKKDSPTYALTVVIEGIPAWAVGEFSGTVTCADGTYGTASFKVEASGKISNGKLLANGTNWTFSSASYDSVVWDPVETYVLVAEATGNKVKRTLRLDVTQQASPDVAADAALAEGSFGAFGEDGLWMPDEDCGLELWRNVWKDADAAAVLAGIGGKYTWLYSNEVDNVMVPLTLDAKSAALKGTAKLPSRNNASVSFSTTALATTNGIEAAFYVAADARNSFDEICERVEVLPFAGAAEAGVAHRDPGVIAVAAMDGEGALGTSKAAVSPAGGQVAEGKTVTLTATADAKNVFYRWEYSYLEGDEPAVLVDEHDKLTLPMDGVHDVTATALFRSKAACTNAPTVTVGEAAEKAFARMEIGVYFTAQVSVPEAAKPVEFSAKNLPTGLSIDKVTGVISGVPTANAKGDIQITAASKANKSNADTLTLPGVTAVALPAWAVGDFSGTVTCADGTHGTVSMKVDAKGAVSSGKLLANGTNWTFAAKSYDETSVTRGDTQKYVILAEAKSGNLTRQIHLNVSGFISPDVSTNASLAAGWFAGTTAGVEMWRTVWKDADAKAYLTSVAGKYTYFFSNETQDVTLPLDLNATSGELKGSAAIESRGNKKVDFKTTVLATTNGIEAVFYVAPAKVGQEMSGEICERFLLVPEAGERETGRAHRAPGVLVSAKAYSDEDVSKCKADVTPKGGQVDKDKDVTLSATPDNSCVFVRWEYVRGGVVFTNENAKFSLKMDGEHDVTAEAVFRGKTTFKTPEVTVAEDEAKKFAAMELGVFFSAKVTVTDEENMKPVKFEAKNLPTGLKIDATTGEISGVPTAAPRGAVTVTATSVANKSKSEAFTFETGLVPAALPWMAVGTFTGFVTNDVANCGTFTLTASDVGKLSAKVVDAAGTYSFTGSGWTDSKDGVYTVVLKTTKGEELSLTLDANVPWNGDQLTGTFSRTATVSGSWNVSAQRNAFGQPWYFAASGDETTGWNLSYADVAKDAPLTVTLKLDGSTTVAGTLVGTGGQKFKVSASGYANVCMMTNGAFVADFAPVVNKKVLSIRTNLWMDRSNDHKDAEDKPNIGFAAFVD